MSDKIPRKPRLKYPTSGRPHLIIDDQEYPIVDISETGAKFITKKKFSLKPGKDLFLYLVFSPDTIFKANARVIRKIGDMVVVRFYENLPLKQFEKEAKKLHVRKKN